MCGICGFIDYNEHSGLSELNLRKMCLNLHHRGPDDEGIFIERGNPLAGLGHRRLSIIDLSASGRQPMSNEDGMIRIVFNGEVYNYAELKAGLEKKGHRFKSHTDTETIIHLYEDYGEKCVGLLRGMFAFAIWDGRKKLLLLARDRLGKKPLIYSYSNSRMCFASEFLALLDSGLLNKEINPEAVDYYLTFGYIPAPLTIYKNIFKLEPAHTLILQNNNLTIKKYWGLDYSHKIKISEQDACEETLRLLRDAVKIRLYSEVPLGAFLSGGIDSSAVVSLMSELSANKVKTFSVGFQEEDYSELAYARKIAQRFGTDHHEFVVKPKALEILPLLVQRYGEPYADSSCIPTYYVSWQTRQYVTVALNGDGGDECFAGYERYQAMLAAEMIPQPLKAVLLGVSRMLPDSANPRDGLRRIKRFIEGMRLPFEKRYVRWISIFNEELKARLYTDEYAHIASKAKTNGLLDYFLKGLRNVDPLDRLLNADVHSYLPNDLLVKVDIASMANSLEARSPFLDHKLMEFAAKLPVEYKMKGFVKKYILKKAIKNMIPKENIQRKKMGFGMPVGEWLRTDLRVFLEETLSSKASLGRGYFKPQAVKTMLGQHILRKKDYSFQLWALLMLELWHKRFID